MSWTPPETDELVFDPKTAQTNNSSWTPPETDEVVHDPASDKKAEQPEGSHFGRLIDHAKEDPGKAALAAGSAAAESALSLQAGKAASHGVGSMIAKAAQNPSIQKTVAGLVGMVPGGRYIAPLVPTALGMTAFAGTSYLANKGIKAGENAVGIGNAINEAQQANKELTQDAGLAVMAPMLKTSLGNYAKLGLKKGLGTAAAAAAGGAAFEPIRYGAETAVNKLTGSDDPVAPVTGESVLHSAGMMTALGAENAKPSNIKVDTSKPKDASTPVVTSNEELPSETPLSEEEAVEMENAIAGKKAAATALDSAAQGAEEASSPAVAQVLREESEKVKKSPVSSTTTKPITNETKIPEPVTEGTAIETPVETVETPAEVEQTDVLPEVPDEVVAQKSQRKAKGSKKAVKIEDPLTGEVTSYTPQNSNRLNESINPQTGERVVWSDEADDYVGTGEYPNGKIEANLPEETIPEPPEITEVEETIPEPPEIPEEATIPEPPVIPEEVNTDAGLQGGTLPEASSLARKLAEENGVDLSQVPVNKQGKISKREVEAFLKARQTEPTEEAIPEIPEVPEVPEEELPEIPEVPEPLIVPDDRPDAFKVKVRKSTEATSFSVTGTPKKPVPFAKAVQQIGEESYQQTKDFFEGLHAKSNPDNEDQAPGLIPGKTKVTLSDAVTMSGDKGAPITFSRYTNNLDYEHLRAIETIKARATGSGGLVFKYRQGGAQKLYQMATNSNDFNFIKDQLRKAGLSDAVLSRDPETGNVTVNALSSDGDPKKESLGKLKKIAYENKYAEIKTIEGDGEQISSDPAQQSALIKESLGRLSGQGVDAGGRADSLRLANALWDRASEAGIEVGERPSPYEDPREKASSESEYQTSLEDQKAADAKVPEQLLPKYQDLLTRTSLFLDRALGLSHLELQELLNDGSDYAKSLLKKINEGALVPSVDDEGRVSFKDKNQGFGNYSGYYKSKDVLKNIVLGRIRVELAEALDTPEGERSPWTVSPREFDAYVEGLLKNAVKSTQRALKKRAAKGLGETGMGDLEQTGTAKTEGGVTPAEEILDVTGRGQENENALDESAIPGPPEMAEEPLNQDLSDAVAFVRDGNRPVEDRLAVLRKIGEFARSKKKGATSDLAREVLEIGERLNKQVTPEQRTQGLDLSRNYALSDLLDGYHRDESGQLKPQDTSRDRTLYRPGFEGQEPERTAPPQILEGTDAHEFLSRFTKSMGGDKSYKGLLRQLLQVNNLKSIPLSVVDYISNGAYGQYDPKTGRIFINKERMGDVENDFNTATEEMIHSLTEYFTDENNYEKLSPRQRSAVDALRKMFEDSKADMIRKGYTSEEDIDRVANSRGEMYSKPGDELHYRFTNLQEWIAGVTSDPAFRDSLDQQSQDRVSPKSQSVWDRVVNFLCRLFGMPPKSVHEQAFKKIMQLASEREAGRFGGSDEIFNRPGMASNFTEKVSKAQENDLLAEEDKVRFRSQTRDQAEGEAQNWINGGGSFEELVSRNAPLSIPTQIRAAGIFRNDAVTLKGQMAAKEKAGERLTAAEIRSKNEAARREKLANQFLAETKSEGGQTLAHGQDLDNAGGNFNPENYIKMLLGGTTEELVEGKMNLRKLYQGIEDIKAEVASISISALEGSLQKAGIEGEEKLETLRSILADPSTSYRNVKDAVASLMTGANPAKVNALAEKIFRMYSAIGNKIGAQKLPKMVHEAYNGESIIPHGDAFMRKLSDFMKLGKFNEDEINKALLESLGLTGYDAEFIKGIRNDIDEMNALPEGDMKNSAKVAIVNKTKKKFYNQVLQDFRNKANRKHIWDMVTAAWQAGVLSGPPTAAVNLFGSSASVTIESLMEATGYAAKTGDMRYFADVYSGFLSAITGNGKGGASSAWNEIQSALGGRGTKYRNASLQEAPQLENIDASGLKGAVKYLAQHGNNLKWVGRIMGALDVINMTAADEAKQRMAMRFFLGESKGHEHSEVVRMMDELFNPDEVQNENFKKLAEADVQKYMPNATPKERERWISRRALELAHQKREQILPGVTEQGREAAENFTYNNTARGFLGEKLVGLTSQINQTLPQGRFVFSFMNTLANIINQTFDYTPYGLLRANNKSYSQTHMKKTDKFAPKYYEEGSPEQMAEKARAYLGTSVLMALAYMAYKGMEDEKEGKDPVFSVHGAGPKDPYKKQELISTGNWQPNSIKVGKVWLRYVDFPILGSLLGGLGTAFDTFRYKQDEQTTAELLGQSVMSGVTTILDKNLLQGANNLFQVFRGDNPAQQLSSLKRLSSGVVAGYTNPGLLRWARGTFAQDKNGMVNQLDNTTTAGWLMSMVPASIGYNTPALNALGEPIKQPWYMASTWRFSNLGQNPHPIFTPLIKAGLMVPPPSKSTSFSVIQPDGSVLNTRMGRHPEVFRRFVELRGEMLKQMLTPETIAAYAEAAKQNPTEAQSQFDRDVGAAAREAAVSQIEGEIIDGKLKL